MRILLPLILLLLCSPAFATDIVLSPELIESLDLFNNSQLLESYARLHHYTTENPDDPAGIFLLALNKWRIMWLSTYNDSDREELKELLERVQTLCDDAAENKDCPFFNASVTGIYAQIAATENQWWETAQFGKKMKEQAEEILEKDEEYYPADYLLGSFNYFADALPGYLKFLRSLVFLPGGDKTNGIKQLNTAYLKGSFVSGEAGRTLAIIYTYYQRKRDYGEKMCRILLTRFPEAYDVMLYNGINLYFDQSWQQSLGQLKTLDSNLIDYSRKHQANKHLPHDQREIIPVYYPLERETRYWIGRNLFQLENYDEAQSVFMELANPPIHQPYWLIRFVYLSLAQIEYHNNNAEAAEEWLSRVLQWKDIKDSSRKARILIKKRGRVGEFDIDFQ